MENNQQPKKDELTTRIEALMLLPTEALKAEILNVAMTRVSNATIRAAHSKLTAAAREAEKAQKEADKAARLAAKNAAAA